MQLPYLRGQVFLAQDKLGEAEQEIATALTIAQEIGNPPQLWKTLVALGDLRQAQGRAEEAQHAYRDALAVVDNVAAGLTDTALRDTLLHSAHVQQIRHRLQAVGQHGAAQAGVP